MLLPEIGPEGQARLGNAKIAVVGAGGLGCAALPYLAAAGIGEITVIDDGVIAETDLHRQILYTARDVGAQKAETAAKRLAEQTPRIKVAAAAERLSAVNARQLLAGKTLALDCSDNFPTRKILNRACIQLKVKCVYAAVYRWEGQLAVFNPAYGPCYECLYPATACDRHGSCSDYGVCGPVAGAMGAFQAAEAIKLIAAGKSALEGKLWLFDVLSCETKTINLAKNPACAACSKGA